MKEDYVSVEIAKLLKEKGFDEETTYAYSNNGELLRLNHFGIKDLTNTDCNGYDTWQFPIEGVASIISAPTHQMAMKWLREAHNIIITIDYDEYELEKIDNKQVGYGWNIQKIENPTGYLKISEHIFGTYEESCEDAIEYCLTNLI